MKQNKKYRVITLAVVTIFLFCSCGSENNVEKNTSPKRETLSQYDTMVQMARISVKRQELEKSGVCNDLYSSVYRGIEEHMLAGKSEQEAIDAVREHRILTRATGLRAASMGILISKRQMDQKMDEMIAGMKSADDYKEIAKAYRAAGTTIEETTRADRRTYEEAHLSQMLYEKVTKAYKEESQAEVYDFEGYWESFQKKMVSDYKKTNDYRKLIRKLDEAVQYYQSYEGAGENR